MGVPKYMLPLILGVAAVICGAAALRKWIVAGVGLCVIMVLIYWAYKSYRDSVARSANTGNVLGAGASDGAVNVLGADNVLGANAGAGDGAGAGAGVGPIYVSARTGSDANARAGSNADARASSGATRLAFQRQNMQPTHQQLQHQQIQQPNQVQQPKQVQQPPNQVQHQVQDQAQHPQLQQPNQVQDQPNHQEGPRQALKQAPTHKLPMNVQDARSEASARIMAQAWKDAHLSIEERVFAHVQEQARARALPSVPLAFVPPPTLSEIVAREQESRRRLKRPFTVKDRNAQSDMIAGSFALRVPFGMKRRN